MSTLPSASQSPSTGATQPTPYQDHLSNFCRNSNVRQPSFQVVSDRRGGRTAWSCIVTVHGAQFPARFFYDGQYINNAKEDAAQRALIHFQQLPSTGSAPPHLRPDQPHSSQQPQAGQQHQPSQQQRYYNGISG